MAKKENLSNFFIEAGLGPNATKEDWLKFADELKEAREAKKADKGPTIEEAYGPDPDDTPEKQAYYMSREYRLSKRMG